MISNFRGCLVGLAVGDALGMPFEGLSFEKIECENVTKNVNKDWTDDTEQALILAESIASTIYFSPEDFSNKLKNAKLSQFYGPTSRKAIEKLKMGSSWKDSGIISDTDGAAMRVIPIGLVYHFNYNLVEDYAVISSIVTHKGNSAIAASVAVAIAIACIINGDERIVEEVIKRCEKYDNLVAEKIEYAFQIRSASLEKAVKEIGNSIMAFDAIPLAFYCYFSSKTFEKAIIKAVCSGGDTDTIAAITGAMKGAEVGIERIPKRFKKIRDYDKIVKIADKLYKTHLRIARISF